jgi:hypothetical protein
MCPAQPPNGGIVADSADRLDTAANWWRLFQGRLAPEERVEVPVLTGSMAPCLPVGSTLIVAPARGGTCRVGDVVVFRDGDRLVAHRLLWSWPPGRPRRYLQAGDGISRLGWVAATAILGLVVAVRDADRSTRDLRSPEARREGIRSAHRRLRRAVLAPLRKGT